MVNVSSLAGRFAPPLQGAYATMQAALELLSEAPRPGARHFEVRVVARFATTSVTPACTMDGRIPGK